MTITRPLTSPLTSAITHAITQAGAGGGLYASLANPSQPLPSFVEGWASNSFHGQINTIPAGHAGLVADSEGEKIYTVNVTGAAAATSLTGTFDTAQTGSWSCSILHDDGTYGIYTASAIAAGTITISPGLRAAATGKPLASLGGVFNGQHYGLQGYKALARKIFATTKREGYRLRYANKMAATATSGWTATGGLPAGNPGYNNLSNAFPSGGAGSYFFSRGKRRSTFDTAIAGRGVTRTVTLGGASGYLELFVGMSGTSGGNIRVVVVVDGVTLYDQSFTEFRRVIVPYTSAASGTVTITNGLSAQSYYGIGDVTWWAYDRTETWTDPAIDKNKNVVVMGDSWSARYSGGLGQELQAAITAAGGTGTVTTVATPGHTAEDGLARFDADVAPLLAAGDTVVIEYFVNDYNSSVGGDSAPWLDRLYRIGRKCQALGAHPVFVMPLPTQSISQCAELGVWTERIGVGLPV